jgi:hypothetical protein
MCAVAAASTYCPMRRMEANLAETRKISERTLYVLSLVVAVLFLGNIYYQLHVAPGWQWGPALDKMPKHLVTDFRTEVYDNAKGGFAAGSYIASDAEFDAALFPEFSDGVQSRSELLEPLIGDGRTVVAVHEMNIDGMPRRVVDIFHVGPRGGRIDSIKRYIAQD